MKVNAREFDKYLDYEVLKEPWNLYDLEDGSTIKLKLVLLKVIPIRKDDKMDYAVNAANVVGVLAPEKLKAVPSNDYQQKPEIDQKDLSFTIAQEQWNEYKVEDGVLLKIKPAITSFDRLKNHDPYGEPIYIVNSQILVKV